MSKTITNIKDYLSYADVEKMPINYENKKKINLFGNEILVENNKWLWHLHLKLTNICNAKCKFCVEQNSKCEENKELYLQRVDEMLSEMEKEGVLFSVSVTGGEPLLFSKFKELCEILKKHDIKFLTMNTNGKYIMKYKNDIDGLFDFIDISRHSIDDKINNEIFGTEMPTLNDLKIIKNCLKTTKVRIQCVMYDVCSIDELLNFIDVFNFADDISFRRLMKLPNKYGVKYETSEELYNLILKYAYDNFNLKEQTIQDYYVYEIWQYKGIDITFSYSNMKMLNEIENYEDSKVCREFIIHPNGSINGSWDLENKIIKK